MDLRLVVPEVVQERVQGGVEDLQLSRREVEPVGGLIRAAPYPGRFDTKRELVLEEPDHVPAEELAGELEHVRKWPAEHWALAFQGQLRPVSEADARTIEGRMRAAIPA